MSSEQQRLFLICSLLTAHCSLLKLVFVFIIVEIVFFNDVQLDWIESDYFKLGTAFLAGNAFAFIRVRINVDIRITLGTCSSRHFFTSNKILLSSDASEVMR